MTISSVPGATLALHNFFRSSTSHRVRIALNLKGLRYDYIPYSLRDGAQRSDAYLVLNPQGLVPALQLADGTVLTQSLSIIEYLDETFAEPPLLPRDALGRCRVRSLAQAIALDIHPLNNLRVLTALRTRFAANKEQVASWFRDWVAETFTALERRLAGESDTGSFCHGDTPTIADICLAAQVVSNGRFDIDHRPYPTIRRIHERCQLVEAFSAAMPAVQPDAE